MGTDDYRCRRAVDAMVDLVLDVPQQGLRANLEAFGNNDAARTICIQYSLRLVGVSLLCVRDDMGDSRYHYK